MAEEKAQSGPSIRIAYFGIHGRAGPIRCAASIGGISYEDRFVNRDEHKAAKQNGTRRWSGLPEVTVFDKDGKELVTIGQSNTCLRYVGKLAGLYPENPVEAALVDEVLDSAEDFQSLLSPSMREKDAEKKKAMREALVSDESKLPYWIKKFEQRFEENEKRGNKNGYIVGDKLTVADIKFYFGIPGFLLSGILDYIDGAKLLGDSKRIMALAKKLDEDEGIKKYRSDFEAAQKEYKEKKTNNFKRDGKGSYGSF